MAGLWIQCCLGGSPNIAPHQQHGLQSEPGPSGSDSDLLQGTPAAWGRLPDKNSPGLGVGSPVDPHHANVKAAGCGLHDDSGPLRTIGSLCGVGVVPTSDAMSAGGAPTLRSDLELLSHTSSPHTTMATTSELQSRTELHLDGPAGPHAGSGSGDDAPAHGSRTPSPRRLARKQGPCGNSSPLLHTHLPSHLQGSGLHSISAISSVASSVDSITRPRGAAAPAGSTQRLVQLLQQSCSAVNMLALGLTADPASSGASPAPSMRDHDHDRSSPTPTPTPPLSGLLDFQQLQSDRSAGQSSPGLFNLQPLSRSNSPRQADTDMPSMRTIIAAPPPPLDACELNPLSEQYQQQHQQEPQQEPQQAPPPLPVPPAPLQLHQPPVKLQPMLSRSQPLQSLMRPPQPPLPPPHHALHKLPVPPLGRDARKASSPDDCFRRASSGPVGHNSSSSGGGLLQLQLSGCSSPRGSSARSADLVISEPETADAYQDNVLLSMLYSNAILIGGDDGGDGSDNTLPRLSPTSFTRQEPAGPGPGDEALDGVLVPLSLLDPDSCLASGDVPHSVQEQVMPSWPEQQQQQQQQQQAAQPPSQQQPQQPQQHPSSMPELQSVTFLSATAPRLMAVSIGGKLVDVPSVTMDATRARSVPALAATQRGGGGASRWVQSVPLPVGCQGGLGAKQDARSSSCVPLLGGGSGRTSRFSRQTVCSPLGVLLASTQDLNSIAEEDEEVGPGSLQDGLGPDHLATSATVR